MSFVRAQDVSDYTFNQNDIPILTESDSKRFKCYNNRITYMIFPVVQADSAAQFAQRNDEVEFC